MILVYKGIGRMDEAVSCYESAVKVQPGNEDHAKGWVILDFQRKNKALMVRCIPFSLQTLLLLLAQLDVCQAAKVGHADVQELQPPKVHLLGSSEHAPSGRQVPDPSKLQARASHELIKPSHLKSI
jgi:hypothetical protein